MTKIKLDELNKAIDAVNGSANKLQAQYQDVGVMTLQHLSDHGDVGPANRLLMGMPKGTRKLAMATWMLTHGALKINDDKDTKTTMSLKFAKDKKTDVEAAKQAPWFDSAPERDISDVFDLQVAFKSLLNRCKGKTLLVGGVPHQEQAVTALKAMAAAVGLPYDDGKTVPIKGNGAAVAEKQAVAAHELGLAADAMASAAVAATVAAEAQKPAKARGKREAALL